MAAIYRTVLVTCLLTNHVIGVTFRKYGPDTSVCSGLPVAPPGTPSNFPLPNVTEQFSTGLELVVVNKRETSYIHEYFDGINNRGVLEQKLLSITTRFWANYKTNQMITIIENFGGCHVDDLGKSTNRFIFGYESINGKPHMYSAADSLRLAGAGIQQVYMGRTSVRDITVDKWRSCQYWDALDSTMVVDWHFSARDYWDSAVGVSVPVMMHVTGVTHDTNEGTEHQFEHVFVSARDYWDSAVGVSVPVMMHVTGVTHDTNEGTEYQFEHVYNFFGFKPYLEKEDSGHFQLPDGVVCPNMTVAQPLPILSADSISFTTESIDNNGHLIDTLKELVSFSHNVAVYEYNPDFSQSTNELRRIQDFNTGVAYVIDTVQGNCSVMPIQSTADDVKSKEHFATLKNSMEFFSLNDVNNLTYSGNKTVRGIACDVWTGTRNFSLEFPSDLAVWEWYFSKTTYTHYGLNGKNGTHDQIPVQIRLKVPTLQLDYTYNIYDYEANGFDISDVDISPCFPADERRRFVLSFEASASTIDSLDVDTFSLNVASLVVQQTGLSPLRVANVNVELETSILVTFDLLGPAPIQGDVKQPVREVDLDSAADVLATSLRNGQFTIASPDLNRSEKLVGRLVFPVPTTTVTTTTPTTTTASTSTSTTTSSSSMSTTSSTPSTSTTTAKSSSPSSATSSTPSTSTTTAKSSSPSSATSSTPATSTTTTKSSSPSSTTSSTPASSTTTSTTMKSKVTTGSHLSSGSGLSTSGLSNGGIAGIVVGLLVFAVIVGVGSFVFGRRYGRRDDGGFLLQAMEHDNRS